MEFVRRPKRGSTGRGPVARICHCEVVTDLLDLAVDRAVQSYVDAHPISRQLAARARTAALAQMLGQAPQASKVYDTVIATILAQTPPERSDTWCDPAIAHERRNPASRVERSGWSTSNVRPVTFYRALRI